MAEQKLLRVVVSASVTKQPEIEKDVTIPIPPAYTQRDIDALTVREIEDTAFGLTWEAFQRTPTRTALLAATARLLALRTLIAGDGPRDAMQEVLDIPNEDAIARWGEDPDGPG